MKTTTLKTKAMSILLAIVVLLGMTPMSAFAADNSTALIITGGTEGTDYTYENGVLEIKKAGTYEIKNVDLATATDDIIKVSAPEGSTVNITLSGVNIDVSNTGNATVGTDGLCAFDITTNCTTNITLKDETTNILKSGAHMAGLQNKTYPLTISCEHREEENHECNSDCGAIEVYGGRVASGIGGRSGWEEDRTDGSNITINGGNITATGYEAGIGGGAYKDGTNIVISGGNITATGEDGAGIGGAAYGNGSNITISGGTVTATSEFGAGIGGGYNGNGSNITISGGTVTTTSVRGAGIGGEGGSGSNITISGGTVTATSESGAGIGGGNGGTGSNITISGGTVTATSESGAGIGGGNEGTGSNIKIAPSANTEIIVNTGANVSEAEELTYAFAEETDITALVSQNAYFYSEAYCIHADADKDHKCDFGCGETMGTHGDTDTDHACDYGCAESIGTHADSDTDTNHLCDYGCGATLENCTDAENDNNHSCDVCGKADVSEHTYGTEWKSDGTNHWHECACDEKADEAAHSGGTATCKDKATCFACGTTYGELAVHNYENGTCTVCGDEDPDYYTFSVQEPSHTTIRNKDGIVLHANIEGNAPAGSYVVWTSSNDNFDENELENGSELEIIAKNKGYTTFTATLYDADGNILATDSVEMYSKSGFFDKIGGFFRSLFGSTLYYEY